MDDITIYKSDGSIICGLGGYESIVKDLDFAGAVLFFDFKTGKNAIVGSRIVVKKGEYGRIERIVALREVSDVDNLIDTIFMFADGVKSLIEEHGYLISDDDFNKIKESVQRNPSREMLATLVLNVLEDNQTLIKSSEPIRTLHLLNDVYEELKPVRYIIDFDFVISGLRYSTNIWISNKIGKPDIDFDSDNIYLEDTSVKLELYEAYCRLKMNRTLEHMKNREEVIKSIQWEANILTTASLGRVLSANDEQKLEMFAERDLSQLLDILVSIENSIDFKRAIGVINRVIESQYKEITVELAVAGQLLNKIDIYDLYKYSAIFSKLYDIIRLDETIKTDFIGKIDIDKIKYIRDKKLQIEIIDDYLGIYPEQGSKFKELICTYSLDDLNYYQNIKTTIRKWKESEKQTIEVDPKLGKPSSTYEYGRLPRIVLPMLVILLAIMCIVVILGFIFTPTASQLLVTAYPSEVIIGTSTDLNISVTADGKPVNNVSIQLSGAVTSNSSTNLDGVAIITVNATGESNVTITANKSGYKDETIVIPVTVSPI